MRLTKKDVKDEEPEQEIGSFEALGGSDETDQGGDTTDQEDVKDEEPEQEIGSFEALGGSDETDQVVIQLTKKMLKMKNQNRRLVLLKH